MTPDRDLAFECARCGHCCEGEGGIVLARTDVERLVLGLGMGEEEFLDKYTLITNSKICLKTGDDGYCIFFRNGCGVHAVKPDVCRAWPFFRGNLIDRESRIMAADYCPGINVEIPQAEFARQGVEYLEREGLIKDDSPDNPNALKIDRVP